MSRFTQDPSRHVRKTRMLGGERERERDEHELIDAFLADESRKAEIEHAKQEQLREQKEGKGEWKQGLASESESVVCASQPTPSAAFKPRVGDVEELRPG